MVYFNPLRGDDDLVVRTGGRRRAKARSQSPYRAAAYWFRRTAKVLKVWVRGDYRSKQMLTEEILLSAWEMCHQIQPQNFPVKANSAQVLAVIAHRVEMKQTVAELTRNGGTLSLDNLDLRIEAYNIAFPSGTEVSMSEQLDELEESYEGSAGRVQR